MTKLFDEATPPNPDELDQEVSQDNQPENKGPDPLKPLFKVGDREYNAEDAMKKIQHAEAFITQLLSEKRELEEKAKQVDTFDLRLQEALADLSKQQLAQEVNHPSQETETVDKDELLEQLRKIAKETASETYEETSRKQVEAQNLQVSVQAAKEAHGESYQEKLKEKGEALGLSPAQIETMAKTNPAFFKATFATKSTPVAQPEDSFNYRSHRGLPEKSTLPRVTGYFSREQSVMKLREAERMIAEGIAKGTYKPRTF